MGARCSGGKTRHRLPHTLWTKVEPGQLGLLLTLSQMASVARIWTLPATYETPLDPALTSDAYVRRTREKFMRRPFPVARARIEGQLDPMNAFVYD